MKKRIICTLLALCMVLSIVPPTAFATDSDVDMSEMNALEAIGFDTSKPPEGFDSNDPSNPYGRDSVTLNPVDELLLLQSTTTLEKSATLDSSIGSSIRGHYDGTITDYQTFSQKTLNQNNLITSSLDSNLFWRVNGSNYTWDPYGVDYTPRSDYAAMAAAAANFDGNNSGMKKQYALVTMDYERKDGIYAPVMRLQTIDATTGKASGAQSLTLIEDFNQVGNPSERYSSQNILGLGQPLQTMTQFHLQNYLKVAAGDFNGDGMDEIAVYVPQASNPRIEVYQYQKTTGASETSYQNMQSNWSLAWTYPLKKTDDKVPNMVSLLAADVNRDGMDDLAVTYGYYFGSMSAGPADRTQSRAAVLYGSNSAAEPLSVYDDFAIVSSDGTPITRAAFTYGPLVGVDQESLVLGGQSMADLNKGKTYSRYVAVYQYDGEGFGIVTDQNYDLFAKDDDGNFVYSIMERSDETFMSLPFAPANLTIISNGLTEAATLYFDSLQLKYSEAGLELTGTLDLNSEWKSGHSGSSYVEYGASSSDLFGYGYDAMATMLYYPGRYWGFDRYGGNPDEKAGTCLNMIVTEATPLADGEGAGEEKFTTTTSIKSQKISTTNADLAQKASSLVSGKTIQVTSSAAYFIFPNTDKDTAYLKYNKSHYFVYSDPKVLAVLASSPYFEDLMNRDDLSGAYIQSETSYAQTAGSSDGAVAQASIWAGAYAAMEQDITIFGIKIGSIECSSTIKAKFTYEFEMNSSLEQTVEYSTSVGADAVVLYSIPTVVYEYTAYTPDGKGGYNAQAMTVNSPHTASIQVMDLKKYEEIAKDYAELPQISGEIMTHTLGDPSTYPTSVKGYKDAIVWNGDYAAVGYTDAPNGQNITQSIDMSTEYSHSFVFSSEAEYTAGVGVGFLTVGVVAGSEAGAGYVMTSTSGSSYTASMQNMPAEAEEFGYGFSWKLFAYDGGGFPVVSYLVTDIEMPPELPDDFGSDPEQSSDDTIALTWSYDKMISGFQIYRYYDFPDGSGDYELAFVPFDQGKKNDNGTWDFTYYDEDLNPYTEYCYKIQALRSVAPNLSIESEGMTVRTKTDMGYPEIELIGLNDDGVLSIYPDSTNTVAVVVKNADDYPQGVSYQWQKLEDGNWVDLNNKKQAYYTFLSSGYSTEGDYRCRVNAIYYNQDRGEEYFISAYSDVFHAKYRVHRASVVGALTADTETGKPFASVTLKSTTAGHKAAPSGVVTFEITGLNYSRTYSAALKAKGTSATASLTTDMTSALPEGAYTLRAYYQGSRVFAPLDLGQITVLSGDEGYRLIIRDKNGREINEVTYGEGWTADFMHYQRVNGKLIEEEVTNWENGTKLYRLGGNGSWLSSGTAGSSVGTWDKPGSSSQNYSIRWPWLAQTPCRSFKLVKTYNETAYTAYFSVARRPLTVGITTANGTFTAAQGSVEDNLPKPCVVAGSLVYGDKLQYDNPVYASDGTSTMTGTNFVDIRVYDTAGREVTLNNQTPPGSYTVIGYLNPSNIIRIETNTKDANGNQPYSKDGEKYGLSGITYGTNYETSFEAATYVVTGKSYTLKASVTNATDKNAPGTVSLVSPEAHSFNDLKRGVKVANGAGLLLLAEPYDGYQVKQWIVKKGDTTILTQKGGNTLIYTMLAEDITVELQYELAAYTLTVNCDSAMGSVEMPVGLVNGALVRPGAEYTFTAVANEGYRFKHWEYVVGGRIALITTPEITVTMPSANVNLYPIFERDVFTLTLSDNLRASYKWDDDGDTSTPEINRYVSSGAEITGDTEVTVSAVPGYEVTGNWQVNGSPIENTDATYTFAITEDTSISAETELGSYTLWLKKKAGNYDFPWGTIHITSEMLDESTGEPLDSTTTEKIENVPGNTEFTMTAIAPRGFKLLCWYWGNRNIISYDETIHYTLQRNEEVTAYFGALAPYAACGTYNTLSGSLTYRVLNQKGEEITSGNMNPNASITFYENETLEVTANPKANYMVDKWTVNGAVESGNHSKTRTFTTKDIPEGQNKLTLEVEFAPQSYYTVNYAVEGTGGTIIEALTDGQPFESGSATVGGGSTVSITAQPNDGMMVSSWKINGEVVKNEYGSDWKGNILTIDALNSDQPTVDIAVSFEELVAYDVIGVGEPRPQGSRITWTLKNDSDVLKTDEEKFYQGQTLIFEAKPDDGYRLTEVNGFDEAEANEDGTWTCIIYAIDQDITVSALVSELYNLICVQPENGTVTIDKTQAIEGETVTVTATPDEGYELVNVLLSVPADPESPVERIEGTTFEMPAKDIQVSAAFALIPHEITCTPAENGSVTTNPTAARAGETVTITATPDEDFQVETIMASYLVDTVETELTITDGTFIMPDAPVTVTAEFAAIEDGGDSGEDGGTVETTVTLSFETNCGKTIDPITVKQGTTVDLTDYVTTRTGYDFTGWYRNRSLTQQVISIQLLADTTIYAKWVMNEESKLAITFRDVPADAYYKEAVDWAISEGITIGVGNGLFAPDEICTRAQIVVLLWRAAGSPEPKSPCGFTDVSETAYYAKAVSWAVEQKITDGMGGNLFMPDASCTRAQSVTFLWRFAGSLETTVTSKFKDVPADSYYAQSVSWAVQQGITLGVGENLFAPDLKCNRAQAVTFLYRYKTAE